jgi:hypothetical protein
MSILRLQRSRLLALSLVLGACTEPRAVERPKSAPAPALEARLELSDSTAPPGAQMRVLIRLRGTASPGVASVTGRLSYDSTAFRFVSEDTLSDGALRVMNPESGVIRFAAVAANGFTDGTVYALRLAVRRVAAVGSLRLTVDEMHTVGRTDATASLAPARP